MNNELDKIRNEIGESIAVIWIQCEFLKKNYIKRILIASFCIINFLIV